MADASVIAVVFDFDDTLAPDTTSKLLREHGVDPDPFWKVDVRNLLDRGYDPAPAYLRLLLDRIGDDRPLGRLSNTSLREFGSTIDDDFFPGLPELFDDLRAMVEKHRDISVEFYIVSGGLAEIIRGSAIVDKYFTGVYACELDEGDEGFVRYIKRAVTFTEKTRYLFEINKGIEQEQSVANPLLVNQYIEERERRVPWPNIIYVGDGMTDIPCFSLVKKNGGVPFGVFQPDVEKSAKQALADFLKPERVVSMHSPRYGAGDDLGSLLRANVNLRMSQILLDQGRAL